MTAVEIDRHVLPVLRTPGRAAAGCGWSRPTPGRSTSPGCSGTEPGWSLVANLPYNVAVPLVVRVLEEAPQVASLLVMVQREVGERLAARARDEAYGAVSVKVAYWADGVGGRQGVGQRLHPPAPGRVGAGPPGPAPGR